MTRDPDPAATSAEPPAGGRVVALDGPGSSGKSSVGAAVAARLGYRFCDTGVLYRALTWLALQEGVDLEDAAALVALVERVTLAPDDAGRLDRVLVDGDDVTEAVRSGDVDVHVSIVARIAEVRAALLASQRRLAAGGGIVMAGRDIGTVVLPDADVKVYLDASAEERARRRVLERGLDPDGPEAATVLEDLRRRDARDSGRAVAPLRAADDAVRIVTDGLGFEATVARVLAVVGGDR
jgi:cytidylate kinase